MKYFQQLDMTDCGAALYGIAIQLLLRKLDFNN